MDWNYFLDENRKFKAKRLPSPIDIKVKIKDITDLDDLRDYLRDCNTIDEAIDAYKHCFDSPDLYEAEFTLFEDCINLNVNGFLGDFKILKKNLDLLIDLQEIFDKEEEWIFANEKIANLLIDHSLIKIKNPLNEEDWIDYLVTIYNLKEMKELALKKSIELKGNKVSVAKGLYIAISQGKIKHKIPYPIRPNEKFIEWLNSLQIKYIEEIEKGLSQFNYPENFISMIWKNVVDENGEWDKIIQTVKERYNTYLRMR